MTLPGWGWGGRDWDKKAHLPAHDGLAVVLLGHGSDVGATGTVWRSRLGGQPGW